VLDLSRLFAGNVLTQILGDFGAEVIKVEPPAGDTLRAWQVKGVSTHWKLYARNKKSLCLELRKPQARELLVRLVPSAQIFVESFRPGTLEKMELAPELLLERNPKLVMIRISGWGQTGPYRRRPGFGTLIEAMSGFASMNGFADREPVLPPMYLADGVAGLYGAAAAMIGLREVEHNGGHGQVIDLPLLDPLFAILGSHAANYRLTGKPTPRTGSRSSNTAPRNVYKCKDGTYVALSASTEKIGAFIVQRTQAENVAFFETAEVTIGPVYDISQIIEDPHVIERELLSDYPDSEMGNLPMHHPAARFSRTPASLRKPAPSLGEHNRELLRELGLGDAAYEELLRLGVAAEGDPQPQAFQE
jgi:formyl-CoA transferase